MRLSSKNFKTLKYTVRTDKNTANVLLAKGYTLEYMASFVGKAWTYTLKRTITL